MSESQFSIEPKTVGPQLVASMRMVAPYVECSKGFAKLARRFGRHICGPPFIIHHDCEYLPDDATYDVCFPVKKGESSDEMQVAELPGGEALTLMHRGPYETLSESYDRVRRHFKDNDLEIAGPTREIYHKGPGMIFKGNPKKYLTEIQFFTQFDT